MLVTHKLEFDLTKPCPGQHIKAVQKDSLTRAVEATLKCNGQPWAVPAGVKVAVAFSKRDGTSGLYDELPDGRSAITYNDDRTAVTAVLAPEVFTVPGTVLACLTLMDNALNKLSTLPFEILVEKNPSADGVVSQNYYNYQDLADINDHLQGIIEGTFPIYTDKTLTAPQRPAEAKATGDAIAALAADLSAVDGSSAIAAEATGSIIALNDASNRPLQGLTIYGKTTQNGTPSPENPAALVNVGENEAVAVTVCGKNLLDSAEWIDYEVNGISAFQVDGNITFNGTATKAFSKIVPVELHLPPGVYTMTTKIISGTLSAGYLMFALSHSVNGDISEKVASVAPDRSTQSSTFSIDEGGYISRWYILVAEGTAADDAVVCLQLEAGGTATAYEPHKAAQTIAATTPNGLSGIPVASGGNYTDESDQQWICDYKDFKRGVRVQRVAEMVLTGTEDWLKGTNPNAGMIRFLVMDPLGMPGMPKKCSHFPYVKNSAYNGKVNGLFDGDATARVCDFAVFADTWPDVDAWKAWLAEQYAAGTPIKIQYALVEPVETVLAEATLAAYAALHTNKTNTTITNDAGAGMQVEYVADTKAYIDNKFAALTAAVMNI